MNPKHWFYYVGGPWAGKLVCDRPTSIGISQTLETGDTNYTYFRKLSWLRFRLTDREHNVNLMHGGVPGDFVTGLDVIENAICRIRAEEILASGTSDG